MNYVQLIFSNQDLNFPYRANKFFSLFVFMHNIMKDTEAEVSRGRGWTERDISPIKR